MLEKIRRTLGIPQKRYREIDIEWIGYTENPSRLVIEFSDGTTRTHADVLPGHIVGLRVAADKLDFYETQIAPGNTALEVERDRLIASTSTRTSIKMGSGWGAVFGAAAMREPESVELREAQS